MFYDTSYGGNTAQGLHMGPDEPMNQVLDPQSNADVTRGSMLQDLADNLGYYVEIDFLIGNQNIVTRGGILYAVGNNYVPSSSSPFTIPAPPLVAGAPSTLRPAMPAPAPCNRLQEKSRPQRRLFLL